MTIIVEIKTQAHFIENYVDRLYYGLMEVQRAYTAGNLYFIAVLGDLVVFVLKSCHIQ